MAMMVGIGKGAEKGILIREAAALEIAHKTNTIILDKTGTLTQGRPAVTDVLPIGDQAGDHILKVAENPSRFRQSRNVEGFGFGYKRNGVGNSKT